MYSVRVCRELSECGVLWQAMVPPVTVFDLWETRSCFQAHFDRPPNFVVVDGESGPLGLLPLSYIDESDSFGYFPGETWMGETWLEQNRIVAADERIYRLLMERCPPRTHLRYLVPEALEVDPSAEVDEVGFLFHPGRYNYAMADYWQEFSGKSRKRLRRELGAIEAMGVEYRYDDPNDVGVLLEMNLDAYGERSYFQDDRFRGGFCSFVGLFGRKGWLRITTALVGGRVAAVDVGVIYNRAYTLIAGGTNPQFPGIAKLINLHHMGWACSQRLAAVDFLCGSFGWKDRFHLSPRPLYQLTAGPRTAGTGVFARAEAADVI